MWRILAVLLALPAAFFTYYTARLVYINLAVAGVSEHRQTGMFAGFVAFPAAAILLGWLSLLSWRKTP
jgi:hypothetical protein